jgi:hypothetical protein
VYEGVSWSIHRLATDLDYHSVRFCWLLLLLLLLLLLEIVVMRVLLHEQILAVCVAVATR